MDTPHDEPSTARVTPQVAQLLKAAQGESVREELQARLAVKERNYFRKAYLTPAIKSWSSRNDAPRQAPQQEPKVSPHSWWQAIAEGSQPMKTEQVEHALLSKFVQKERRPISAYRKKNRDPSSFQQQLLVPRSLTGVLGCLLQHFGDHAIGHVRKIDPQNVGEGVVLRPECLI